MRVLLIKPHPAGNVNSRLARSVNEAQGIYPPLGLAYTAAVLEKKGHDVKIMDCHAENLILKEVGQRIKKASPDLVGVYAMTPFVQTAYAIGRQAQRLGITTVVGGPQMMVYPRATMQNKVFDYGVAWEGEVSLPQLVEHLEGKREKRSVEGLVYWKGEEVKQNPGKTLVNLDETPFPARHLLPNQEYFSILAKKPFTTTTTARGCPFRCDYCFKSLTEEEVRYRSPENVVREIQHCVDEHGTKSVWFYDDTFTLNKKHVRKVCEQIIEKGLNISWQAPTRVDLVDSETLSLMKRAGCEMLRLGIESGSNKTLRLMNKGTNTQQAVTAVKKTKQAGIKAFGFFMLGYLNETEESIEKTIELSKRLGLDWAMFSNVVPYPKTPLYRRCVEQGVINDYWKNFTLEKTSEKMSPIWPGIEEWVEKAYKEFYFRPGFVAKKLLDLTNPTKFKQYLRGLHSILRFHL